MFLLRCLLLFFGAGMSFAQPMGTMPASTSSSSTAAATSKQTDAAMATVSESFYLYAGSDEKPFQLFTKPGAFKAISCPRKDAKEDLYERDTKSSNSICAVGEKYTVALSDETDIHMTHYDRGSDTLIVLGHGYGSTSKRWKYVIPLLKEYDIVTFDYRWHTRCFCLNPSSIYSPIQSRFFDEQEEVVAVVGKARQLKKYKQVIGLAECYSCLTFIVAQAGQEVKDRQLFDKLVLDSSFVSLRSVSDDWVRGCLKKHLFYWFPLAISHCILPDISMTSYIAQITKTPLLFIHGGSDEFVTLQALMEGAFDVTKAPKVLLKTPYGHVHSGLDWGIYKFVCDQFIQSASQADFIERLKSTI